MRNMMKKTVAVVMVGAAALALSACKSETTNTTENVSMTDMNAEGSMNDVAATDLNAADNSVMGDSTTNVE